MDNIKINLKCSQIRDCIKKGSIDKMWEGYFLQIKEFQEIWEYAISDFAYRISIDNQKRQKHLETVRNAFSLMDDWYYDRKKIVKARRNEIDSSISFIRNNALNRQISDLFMAPVMRNLASLLRGLLNISTTSYSVDQIPVAIAQGIFDIAAVRVLFPIDLDNLISYLPSNLTIHGEGGHIDNYHIMLEEGSKALGLDKQLNALYEEVITIWNSFNNPRAFNVPEFIWNLKGGEMSTKIYFDSLKKFHSSN